ncbi:hypothetical protein BJ322DRAFT_543179 [Thelephora terrestris]|uniref:Uncharacterized protein n=1 Tax=Thelephora terrestris TaxID=56493 RepID=A0A9P6HLG1_9AGAM|nr:hypothetical protein BJ322DRAFT_543179 [Thelephora terrestris]
MLQIGRVQRFRSWKRSVGIDVTFLYTRSEAYLKPDGIFVTCGPKPSGFISALGFLWDLILRPRWLGGTKRRLADFLEAYEKVISGRAVGTVVVGVLAVRRPGLLIWHKSLFLSGRSHKV